jgi:hypothetical protein
MGIALFILADLFTPLQTLAHRWIPARHLPRHAGLRYMGVRPVRSTRAPAVAMSSIARPLRVVRVVDPQHGNASGRVVISGRMADVCAELDRLAALEAAGELQRTVH